MADATVVKAKGSPIPPKTLDPFYGKTNLSHRENGMRKIEKGRIKSAALKSLTSFSRVPQAENILKNENAQK